MKMNILIEKIKISNFLSFFGKYEVNFKPYTAIMCNFYEGKDDFLRALEFVFGANMADLRVEKPLDLVHKTLREEFLINSEIQTFVEVTLKQEKKEVKFCRSVKNGVNNVRIDHKISDLITTSLLYEEKLNSLGIHIKQKNLIYYKSYFNNVIWGSSEDLEETICTCLRESYLLEEWEKANKEVQYLTKLKNKTAMKNYNSMKKSNSVIAKYSKKFEVLSLYMEKAASEILEFFVNDSSTESTPSLTNSSEAEIGQNEVKKEKQNIPTLEGKINVLTEKLNVLKLQEALLTSQLLHEEIKVAAKPVNASTLQNRIIHIKTKIQEKETRLSEIWKDLQTVQSQLEFLNRKISFVLISIEDLQMSKFRQNRFTQYGRFHDYLQPSRYVQLLKQIIGDEIYYAHLCDSVEDALALLMELKDMKYEHRENFIPFENYSHKLKDIITASGEQGVQINTLEELLIFLCKLKHYELIDEVPVIIQRNFNFETEVPEDFTIYVQINIHFTSDGAIILKTNENDFYLDTEIEIEKNLVMLYTEEEINYRKWNELLFLRWETLIEMNSLENDVFCLKQKWKKSTQKTHLVRESSPPTMEIYEEFSNIFKEYVEQELEIQQEESFLSEKDSSVSSNEESVTLIIKDLEDIITEKGNTEKKLKDYTSELHLINVTPIPAFTKRINYVKFKNNLNKTKLFFEKEFKKLKKLMKEDDLDDFLGSQEWRTTFITSLIRDFDEIKMKLKSSTAELQNIATKRKRKLYQLFDHCSRYLTSTFRHILDQALPFLKLNFGPGEEKIHLMSSLAKEEINVIDIKHFNTLIKFFSGFSLFLEIAKFDKIPFMIFDDFEDYFPLQNDNLEGILNSSTIEKLLLGNENRRFHLLMRLGQFLEYFIKKNTPGKSVRNNGNNKDYTSGPIQIIYFTKEDFIHTAEHYIWIQSQILPDEYISEHCNSYSEIHELNFKEVNGDKFP